VKDGTLLAIRVKSRYRFSIGLEKLEEGKTKREREREREREKERKIEIQSSLIRLIAQLSGKYASYEPFLLPRPLRK
jgi:hypothetical protein